MLGKIDSPSLKKLEEKFIKDGGSFKNIKIGKLFDIHPTKSYGINNDKLFETSGKIPVIVNSSSNNGVGGYVNLEPTESGNKITFSDTTTSDAIFYQPNDFIGYSHVQGLYPWDSRKWNEKSYLYFLVLFKKSAHGKFDYANKFNRNIAKELEVKLPVNKNDSIDFEYMETYVSELEEARIREFTAYLKVGGLDDYVLSVDEEQSINNFNNLEWATYNLKNLFGKSTRGKRLKSEDRIPGDLPFVTAGEADEGISGFIGNNVQIFSKNTTTIDMFGSAKYRNYEYGGDDHVAIVHTENLPMNAAIFVTSAIHKASHNGQFDYGRNFYAKDADELYISLPTKDGKPDFDTMATIISAIQKLVIKDVVIYANDKYKEIYTYREENQIIYPISKNEKQFIHNINPPKS